MDQQYRPDLKAHVTTDDQGRVRQVLHTDERWLPDQENPRRAAMEYFRKQADLFGIRGSALELIAGQDFTADHVRDASNRDITVTLLANDMVLGGMTYRLDPSLKAAPGPAGGAQDSRDRARDLLRCLDIPGGKVRDVHVTKVSIDVCMEDDCC